MNRKKTQTPRLSENLKSKIGYVMLVFCLLLVFSFAQSIQRAKTANKRLNDLNERVETLQEKKEALQKEVNEADSEKFVESQLRTKLGLAKDNEIVIILPEDDIVRSFASVPQNQEESLPDPNWKKWINLFL